MAEITLNQPIRIRGVYTHQIRLGRLTPEKMRGMSLDPLLRMDVKAITRLLTVIARPRLRRSDVNCLSVNDFTQCALTISHALLEGTSAMADARAEVAAEQEADRG